MHSHVLKWENSLVDWPLAERHRTSEQFEAERCNLNFVKHGRIKMAVVQVGQDEEMKQGHCRAE